MPALFQRMMVRLGLYFANLAPDSTVDCNSGRDGGNPPKALRWRVNGLSPETLSTHSDAASDKMALCISQGHDTSALRRILLNKCRYILAKNEIPGIVQRLKINSIIA